MHPSKQQGGKAGCRAETGDRRRLMRTWRAYRTRGFNEGRVGREMEEWGGERRGKLHGVGARARPKAQGQQGAPACSPRPGLCSPTLGSKRPSLQRLAWRGSGCSSCNQISSSGPAERRRKRELRVWGSSGCTGFTLRTPTQPRLLGCPTPVRECVNFL